MTKSHTRRTSLVLVACFALFAQVFALAHLMLVPHTRCAEHGETIHEGAHDTAVVETRRVPLADGQVALAPAPADASGDEHEHCQVLTDRRAWRTDHASFCVALSSIETVPFVVVLAQGFSRGDSRCVSFRCSFQLS